MVLFKNASSYYWKGGLTLKQHKFISPYLGSGTSFTWLRGNHHGHSTRSDGTDEPLTIIRSYEEAGYDYFALSEHDFLVRREELQPYTKMCVIPAIEVTAKDKQTLLYLGADEILPVRAWTPKQIMDRVHQSGGLFIFDHPNWKPFQDYATDQLLDSMEGIKGIEIYTGVIERLYGQALATDRWDYLLSKGWKVFGHGTDDQHHQRDQFIAWNCVQWADSQVINPKGVIAALSEGRFYASTGVSISNIETRDDNQCISVDSDGDEIHWISRNGVILKKVNGGSSSLTMKELREHPNLPKKDLSEAIYVRIECLGRGNRIAWSQPFWVVPEE
jgi:hypothetical protein